MNWKLKSVLQSLFSHVPSGEQLNYLCQRYITKSLPFDDSTFDLNMNIACEQIQKIEKYIQCHLQEATFFEFGAGYELTIPLTYYALGVSHQVLVDIRKLVRGNLINHTISQFQHCKTRDNFNKVPSVSLTSKNPLIDLRKHYGLKYIAPCDARDTRLQAESFDCIASVNTLEHISIDDIRRIITECHRILKHNGIMSHLIDYSDHYSYADKNISSYNFLKYSDDEWKKYAPSLQFQNRMRHSDYIRLFRECGFRVLEEQYPEVRNDDISIIEGIEPSQKFLGYASHDLAIKRAHIVLGKVSK